VKDSFIAQSHSVIGSWPLVISRALNAYQLDGQSLLRRVGIDPVQAAQPETRYSLAQLNRVWRLVENLTKDEAVGLTVARFVRPTSWQALGFAIWASNTLMAGFERLAGNFRMFADYGSLKVSESNNQVDICLYKSLTVEQWCAAETDAFMGTCMLTARHIFEPGLVPIQVSLSRPQPTDPTPWQRVFKCPVFFNAAFDKITFNEAAMHQPLLTASPELAAQNDALVADYLARFDRSDLRCQLESLLLNHLPLGTLTLSRAAQHLGLSSRTLQRRLTDKGINFQAVVDALRSRQALLWVETGHLPLSEVGYRLGFSNAGNFTRAFKRWYQQSPKQRRRQALSG
tara:strand:+ start:274 stop:1302 length:1029 start_codon:yes stop_codon:yes gene_type:complete